MAAVASAIEPPMIMCPLPSAVSTDAPRQLPAEASPEAPAPLDAPAPAEPPAPLDAPAPLEPGPPVDAPAPVEPPPLIEPPAPVEAPASLEPPPLPGAMEPSRSGSPDAPPEPPGVQAAPKENNTTAPMAQTTFVRQARMVLMLAPPCLLSIEGVYIPLLPSPARSGKSAVRGSTTAMAAHQAVGMRRAMRSIAYLPVGFFGLVLAASHCGGSSLGLLGDPSVDDSGAGASSGIASAGSATSGHPGSGQSSGSPNVGSGATSGGSGGASGASTGRGGTAGSQSGGSSGSAGSGGSTGSSGSGGHSGGSSGASSGEPHDAGHEDARAEGGASGDGGVSPCLNKMTCGGGQACCGSTCCGAGQLCCLVGGPVPTVDPYYCMTPTASQKTCPPSCAPKCVSDRNVKRDVEPVDQDAILESVARMPVSTWSYKSEDPSVRHMGPMAQDFQAAFGLGDTDRAYDPIDAHGVAFAAIQGLYEQMREQGARIERLERENEALRERQCVPGPLR